MMPRAEKRTAARLGFAAACLAILMTAPQITQADGNVGPAEPVNRFTTTDGQTLYSSICQGCHMSDAKGAHGAGMFPALSRNPKLVSATYPAYVLLNGLHGMPSFARDLDDVQIAAVANFVVTHFGNKAKSLTTAEAVKALRSE